MKQTIRLTENELHDMIEQTVRRRLSEGWNGNTDTAKGEQRKKESDMKAHQHDIDQFAKNGGGRRQYAKSGTVRTPADYSKSDSIGGDEVRDAERDNKRFNQNAASNARRADKRWQKAADSRPLHRKGSLNRAENESLTRKQSIRLSESELHDMIYEAAMAIIKEDMDGGSEDQECISFDTLNSILNESGWAFTDSYEVSSRDGRRGVRYVLDEDPKSEEEQPLPIDQLVQKIKQAAEVPNGIFVSTGRLKYANEISHYALTVLYKQYA